VGHGSQIEDDSGHIEKDHRSKISNLMASFKNIEEGEERTDLSDHLEQEFLDIIHLFTNERKQ
jgi:hypothetical protein